MEDRVTKYKPGDVVYHPLHGNAMLVIVGEATYTPDEDVKWGPKYVVRFKNPDPNAEPLDFRKKAYFEGELLPKPISIT